MDISKLPNYINIVLCDCFTLAHFFFSIFASHKSGNFVFTPFITRRLYCLMSCEHGHTHKELIEERNNKNLEKNQPQLQIQEV